MDSRDSVWAGGFPSTMWTVLEQAQQGPAQRARLDEIIRSYWQPVYVCIRAGWRKSAEDAADLTQAFFAALLDGDVLQKVQRGRGRFRAFLRATLRNFLSNQHRHARQLKRGGGRPAVPLDVSDPRLEALVAPSPERTPEEIFDHEWARSLLEAAIEEFERRERAAGNDATVEIFRLYQDGAGDDEGPFYDAIASKTGLTRDAVKHQLVRARAALRELIVERIKEYALDEVEVQQELELLRGAWR